MNNGNMLYQFQLMCSCLYLGKSDDALMIKPSFLAIPAIAEHSIAEYSRMFRPFEQHPLTQTASSHPSMLLVCGMQIQKADAFPQVLRALFALARLASLKGADSGQVRQRDG